MGGTTSSQKFIARNRAPRVQIEYDVELYGVEKKIQLPFVMGVMADLVGKPAEPQVAVVDRKFLETDADSFDVRPKAMKPRVVSNAPNVLTGEGNLNLDITFESTDDLSLAAVARKVDSLNKLPEACTQLANLLTYMDGKTGAEEMIMKAIRDPALFQALASAPKPKDDEPQAQEDSSMAELNTGNLARGQTIIEQTDKFASLLLQEFKPKTECAREVAETAVQTLVEHAPEQTNLISNDAIKSIESIIAAIDTKLTAQVNLIVHHVDFQQLEGVWRGLHYLVNNTETDEQLKIRVLNISKLELHKTPRKFRGTTWDQSPIFKKLYEEEYGQFGDEPYGCLVDDYYFDQPLSDVELLGEMAKISATTHASFISVASPMVMGMGSQQELSNLRDLTKVFTIPEYAGRRSLCESEDFRYIGLTTPCFLACLLYGAKTDPVEEFAFEEETDGADSSKYAWANSAHATAVNINRSFKLYGWCLRIRGVESGGEVQGLSAHTFPTDDGGVGMKYLTKIAIPDRRETELAKSGFMPLLYKKNTDLTAFIGAQSLQKPAEYDDLDVTANVNPAARLPYLFATCRFAHYLKYIVRNKIGPLKEKDEMQRWLQDWILNYVDGDPVHSTEITKVQHPLAAAEVVMEEVEDNPGYYNSKFFLRPHYQFGGLMVSLRLVSRLPSAKEA